jgi:hypothetical protein
MVLYKQALNTCILMEHDLHIDPIFQVRFFSTLHASLNFMPIYCKYDLQLIKKRDRLEDLEVDGRI